MRACPACGASNDPTDDFCGNCGAYLGWPDRAATQGVSSSGASSSGTASEPPTSRTPAPDAAQEPPVPGTSSAPPAPSAPRPTASQPPTAGAPARSSAPGTPAQPPAAAAASPAPSPPPAQEPPAHGSSLRTRLTGRGRGAARAASTAPAAGPRPRERAGETSGATSGEDATTSPAALPRPDDTERSAPEPRPATERSAPEPRPATGEATGTGEPTPTTAAPTGRPARATPPASAPRNAPGPRPPAAPTPESPAPAPIQPVRPAKPVAPRPVLRPVAAPDDAAGPPCPSCGTPNPPGRRFCRRCAAVLNPAAKPEALPWWRTAWPFRRKVRASSGRTVRLLVILAVVVALCTGGFLLLPAGRALFEDTRDKLGKAQPITPVDIEASAETPAHPAKNTMDGVSNSYWGAPAPGASVRYTFREPFRLVDMIITNGPSKDPEQYVRQARALRMDLVVTTRDGGQQRKELTLSDKAGPQTISTGISDVRTVRLVLRSPVGLTAGRQLALAEVEFFQRG